jgi:hypothetical protein
VLTAVSVGRVSSAELAWRGSGSVLAVPVFICGASARAVSGRRATTSEVAGGATVEPLPLVPTVSCRGISVVAAARFVRVVLSAGEGSGAAAAVVSSRGVVSVRSSVVAAVSVAGGEGAVRDAVA